MKRLAPNLGSLIVHDRRIGVDHQLHITAIELRNGHLQITADGIATLDGSIEPEDALTIQDPDGRPVCRVWVNGLTLQFHARERIGLTYSIPLGSQYPVITGDAGLDISL